MHLLGSRQEGRERAGGFEDLQGAGLNGSGARLAVRLGLALDEPRRHAMPGQLSRREQPRRTGADDQNVAWAHDARILKTSAGGAERFMAGGNPELPARGAA